ncbi:MAG: hypothetical protein F6K11_24455, partial [Leptolyngbya sp. SIO3F4]|nr:hypothetical protein [Leptolyngbya sp. SIO3F4]
GKPFKAHGYAVYSVAIGADGNTVRLWDRDGTPIGKPFKAYEDSVNSVAISGDGTTIVSGSSDQTVRLWDRNGTPIGKPFKAHEDDVRSVAISVDGTTIVSGSSDQTVRLWDRDGTPIGQPFKGHEADVRSVAISSDGNTIVSGSSDQTVRLWSNTALRSWVSLCCKKLHNNWRYDPSGQVCKTCLIEKGHQLIEANQFDDALDSFRRALRAEHGFRLDDNTLEVQAKQLMASTLVQHGQLQARIGNLDAAIHAFTVANDYDDRLSLNPIEEVKRCPYSRLLLAQRESSSIT